MSLDLVRWLVSGCLIGFGLFMIAVDWWAAVRATRRYDGRSYSMVPIVFGMMLAGGVLILPVELPINRLFAAYPAMSVDVNNPLGIGFWIMLLTCRPWRTSP